LKAPTLFPNDSPGKFSLHHQHRYNHHHYNHNHHHQHPHQHQKSKSPHSNGSQQQTAVTNNNGKVVLGSMASPAAEYQSIMSSVVNGALVTKKGNAPSTKLPLISSMAGQTLTSMTKPTNLVVGGGGSGGNGSSGTVISQIDEHDDFITNATINELALTTQPAYNPHIDPFGPPPQPPSTFFSMPNATNALIESHSPSIAYPNAPLHPHLQHYTNGSTSHTTATYYSPAPLGPAHMNANLYIKLLNSHYDCSTILKQLQQSHPSSTRSLLTFLAGRCQKLQRMLDVMGSIASEPDTERAMVKLFECAREIVGGKVGSLYVIDDATGMVMVRLSDWRFGGGVSGAPAETTGGVGEESVGQEVAAEISTGRASEVKRSSTVNNLEGNSESPASDSPQRNSTTQANTQKPQTPTIIKPSSASTSSASYKSLQLSQIFGSQMAMKSEMVNIYNLTSSDLYTDELHEEYKEVDPQCILVAPIMMESNSKVTGFIEIINKKPSVSPNSNISSTTAIGRPNGGPSGSNSNAPPYFNAEDEFCLKTLCSLWTLLLSQTHVRQQALRKSDDIQVLLNTASLMSSELDLGELITVIMQTARELLNAERCALFMLDKEKGELWSTLAQGAGEIRIPMNKGIAGHVAVTGEILNIPDAYHDKRFNRAVDMKTGFRTRNILCMPMRNTQGEVIGVTQVINKLPEGRVFSKEDELLLMAFSSLAAVTIEKSILFKALQVTLQETNHTKNFLHMILQSITNVVLTLDSNGRLLTVNHPDKLEFADMLATMKVTSFDYWLGKENASLVSDIQKVYRGEGTVIAQDYELILQGREPRSVNYTIVEMTAEFHAGSGGGKEGGGGEDNGSDHGGSEKSEESITVGEKSGLNAPPNASELMHSSSASLDHPHRKVKGVVIVIEDISKEKRVMNTLGRYMNPQLVHKVMSDGGNALGGTRQKISVVFADLRNCEYNNIE
jgi:putative methionine-R-sulfoxide reductase with GAF domain